MVREKEKGEETTAEKGSPVKEGLWDVTVGLDVC
jgi:hypothetical protein